MTLAETLNDLKADVQVEKGAVTLVSEDLRIADLFPDDSYLDRPHSDEQYQPYVELNGEVARLCPASNTWVQTR